jgi:carboxylate-amine ligase
VNQPHARSSAPLRKRLAEGYERFEDDSLPTLGLEEELVLLDPDRLVPVDAIERALALLDGHVDAKPDLRACQLELLTRPCAAAADVARELAAARAAVVAALGGELRLAGAGTTPTGDSNPAVTDLPRYRRVAADFPGLAARATPNGLHVHVGLGGRDRALAVYNATRSYLPELAALAANSPILYGEDTGLASKRLDVLRDWRTAAPPSFASWEQLTDFVAWGRRSGLIPDPSFLWWDLRLNPAHGTLEFRIADTQTEVADAGALAAVCQCLVVHLCERFDGGERLPAPEAQRISENRWRATRLGVDATLVDLDSGEPVAARAALLALLERLEPYAATLGCGASLAVARRLAEANGAVRQRAVVRERGIDALAPWLVETTERGAAAPPP